MSYSENGGAQMTMPVAPMYGGGYGNGMFGGDGAWWLIILLLFANNGWGNGIGKVEYSYLKTLPEETMLLFREVLIRTPL